MVQKRKKKRGVAVVHDSDCNLEVLADAIIEVSKAIKKLKNTRMNEHAITLLIKKCMKHPQMSQRNIQLVLDIAEELPDHYLKEVE